jgi:hypothetical protein
VSGRLAVLARVECRSEGAGEQVPVAVWLAADRVEVGEILDDALVGSSQAGEAIRRRLQVRLEDSQELVLERDLPDGDWRVYRAAT